MHYFRMHDDIMMPGDYPGAWEIYSHGMHLPKANRNNIVKLGGVCGNKEKKTVVVIRFQNENVLFADAYREGDDDVTKYTEEDETSWRCNRITGAGHREQALTLIMCSISFSSLFHSVFAIFHFEWEMCYFLYRRKRWAKGFMGFMRSRKV